MNQSILSKSNYEPYKINWVLTKDRLPEKDDSSIAYLICYLDYDIDEKLKLTPTIAFFDYEEQSFIHPINKYPVDDVKAWFEINPPEKQCEGGLRWLKGRPHSNLRSIHYISNSDNEHKELNLGLDFNYNIEDFAYIPQPPILSEPVAIDEEIFNCSQVYVRMRSWRVSKWLNSLSNGDFGIALQKAYQVSDCRDKELIVRWGNNVLVLPKDEVMPFVAYNYGELNKWPDVIPPENEKNHYIVRYVEKGLRCCERCTFDGERFIKTNGEALIEGDDLSIKTFENDENSYSYGREGE